MSRLFNQTRKASNLVLEGTKGKVAQTSPEEWVDDLRRTSRIGTDIAEVRLGNCRKTRFTNITGTPTLANPAVSHGSAMEAYRMLRTRLMRAQTAQGIRSIVLSSAVSNEGKTLTAFNLAQAYAGLEDQRVLLIDGDLRTSALSQFFLPNSGPGLSDALAGNANFSDAIMATNKSNLFFVPTGEKIAPPPELYASERWKEFLTWASECFKVILIDAPPISPLSDFDLIAAGCDGIVFVVRAQRTHRELLQKAATQLDPKKLLGIVYNATQSESRKSKYNNPYIGTDSQ
jgi:capsular exopolysaccharide synthesis family protein